MIQNSSFLEDKDILTEQDKLSETFFRVAKVLIGLTNIPMDYNDIYNYLNDNGCSVEYSPETFNKYLNTLRVLGLIIEKDKDKFTLFNFLTQVVLNEDEIKAFKNLEKSILIYGTNKNIKMFFELKKRILKYFDSNTRSNLNCYSEQELITEKGFLVKLYEQFCEDGQRIKVRYKDEIYTVEPKSLSYSGDNVYLNCINVRNLTAKKFNLCNIILIEKLPTKNSIGAISCNVTFKLSGKLAKIYCLKTNEDVIEKSSDKLIVKSDNEDWEYLAKRLARYQNLCTILQPKEFKEYFKNYLERIFDVYKD